MTVRQGPNCAAARVQEAFWDAIHPNHGFVASISFMNYARSARFYVNDYTRIGRWTWKGTLAFDYQGQLVYQWPTHTDVRLASYGRVAVVRIGSKINVRTTAMRYWQHDSNGKFIGWSGARGLIQYRTPGTATWKGLKEVYSYSNGTYSYTYTTTASREYRVILRDVSTIWGSTSPVVRR